MRNAALQRGRFQPENVSLTGGRLNWEPAGTNQLTGELALNDIAGELRFLPRNCWELTHLQSHFRGAEMNLSGLITNVAALRSKPGAPAQTNWPARVESFLARIDRMNWSKASTVHLNVRGDARDLNSLQIALKVKAPAITSPEGGLSKFTFHATAAPSADGSGALAVQWDGRLGALTGQLFEAHGGTFTGQSSISITNLSLDRIGWLLRLESFRAQTVTGKTVSVGGTTVRSADSAGTYRSELTVDAARLESPWGVALTNHVEASLLHGVSRNEPWQAKWRAGLGPIQTRWGKANAAHVSGQTAPNPELPRRTLWIRRGDTGRTSPP